MELQNEEFSDGMGLEMYEYKYRFYDHQIGRFISQDRLADKYAYYSPYQFAGNQVPNAIDLDGLEPYCPNFAVQTLLARESPGGEQAHLDNNKREGIAYGFIGFAIFSLFNPEIGIPMAVSYLSGVPVTPSPQVMAETTTTVVAEETVTTASETVVSMADKARVLTAGGEIGMMDGVANLSVNSKSGYFSMSVNTGSETSVLSGEIKIANNSIQFGDLTVRNAQSSSILGAIDKQGSIGFSTFSKLQKEMTELTKAGGYDKATIEFSKLRPDGSPLQDMPSRTITLFDNTIK